MTTVHKKCVLFIAENKGIYTPILSAPLVNVKNAVLKSRNESLTQLFKKLLEKQDFVIVKASGNQNSTGYKYFKKDSDGFKMPYGRFNLKEVIMAKETFRDLLEEKDMHGAQLARRLGISTAAVSKWCVGEAAPNYNKLPEIAKVLDVSIERIVSCFVEET